ncbi:MULTISPECIES: MBL fold metallo-hydrolase [Halomicrobium]|uniref:Beta-lactamase domain protein n=2 Tax=Halomicrobium mukohataei TaxID=57705 RepID=C7P348_HALMD|nr:MULTISPECIES: MBL fold metallo-hydrolase [Halomicrobium]ACV47520.1 beta-lactamase domain protein [Halomicrobium mukohataei DSM 12286]QCD65984.1 MBL fold metallo-hydrolase [Halomicrobium mukohataei]QFR20789.1 MBL fold metallo-hydrolase [Halomicrobium sp. ZPS1]
MVTRLADGVWWIDLRGVNAYLIDEAVAGDGAGSGVTLVDAGLPWHGTQLSAAIAAAGYELRDIERVLVTHYDIDHVGGLAGLDGLDAPIYVGEADAELVAGRRRPPWHNHKGLFQRAMAGFVSPPTNRIEPVTDGDTVGEFTVYATPGHTPGHVAYVSERASVGLLGDLVRESRGTLRPSPWLLSYATGEVERSIAELNGRAPDFAVLGMGHGRPFERDGRERLTELARE